MDAQRTCPHCGYVFEPFEEGECPHCRHLAELHPAEPQPREVSGAEMEIEPQRLPAEPPQCEPLPSDAEAVARMRAQDDRHISWSGNNLSQWGQPRNTPAGYLMGTFIGLVLAAAFAFAATNPHTSSGRGWYSHIATHDERLLLWGGAIFGAILAITFFIKFINGDE